MGGGVPGAASVFGTTGEVVAMRVHFPYRR